jgi:hypothetical protein
VSDGFLVKKAITLNGLGINEIMAQSEWINQEEINYVNGGES